MATKKSGITKQQAEQLLAQYLEEQKAATALAEDAFNRKADAERDAEKAALGTRREEAKQTAAAAYDTQAVQTLINKRRLAEQMANWGLTNSGLAKAGEQGVARSRQVADRAIAATQKAALADLKRRLNAVDEETRRKKQQNSAALQRTLVNKVAEKRLSLSKSAL